MRRLVAVTGIVVAVLGYGALDVYDVAPGVLTLAPVADPVPSAPLTSAPVATLGLPRPAQPGMPLPPSGAQAPLPTEAGLRTSVAGVLASPSLAGAASVAVRDGTTGAHLLDLRADEPRTPASTLKLLSAAAVDATFPAGATLTTKVVQRVGSDQVVLVAGGDTLLAPGTGDPAAVSGRAGLEDLVATTAKTLQDKGVHTVRVALDLSYAPGPLTAPTWSSAFQANGVTGAVAAIGLSSQRATPGHPGPADPPASVATAFVSGLRAHGIEAEAAPQTVAPADAAVLAAVTSAPVSGQLSLALEESDNALTESLTRQAAFSSGARPGFAETAAFVRTTLAGLGVDLSGVRSVDGCGLSRENLLPARVIADVMALGISGAVPGLRDTVRRLPVAGLSGTLSDRFGDGESRVAAGLARAKTGTLTGVNAIAGTVVTADGRLLTFTVLVGGVGSGAGSGAGTLDAREALDRFVATLARCGCRI